MKSTPHDLMGYLRIMVGAWRDDPRDDAELLTRLAEGGDDVAFRVLVGRHGALVWRTCKRVLGNTQDAEDAFQSVFMTLTRKAGRLRREPLAGWLYRVARQAALNTDAGARRRQNLEKQPRVPLSQQGIEESANRTELYAALDEELARLPEKLRIPLVLCFLEGKSQIEAAEILGCTRRVVQYRITQAETVLRKRLERRGMTLGGLSVAVALLGDTGCDAAVPSRLIESTAQAAISFRTGSLTGASAEMVENLLRAITVKGTFRASWWVVLASIGALGIGGAGKLAWKMFEVGSEALGPVVSDTQEKAMPRTTASQRIKRIDCYGDPLPQDAIARIGTTRFRGVGTGMRLVSLMADLNSNLEANVALSSDGKMLVLADGLNIYLWDAVTGKQLHKITMEGCEGVAFSPDSKILINKTIRSGGYWLLDTATGQSEGEPFEGWGTAVFSPDGKTIACTCKNRGGASFYLYDSTERVLRRKIGPELDASGRFPVFAAFSRDGRSLGCVYKAIENSDVAGMAHGAVYLLDVETGKELTTLKIQQEIVRLVFTSDGNVVTGGKDKTVRVWDVKTGKELRYLGAMDHVPTVIALLPDSTTVLAACTGQIRFWDLSTGKETRPALICKGLFRPIILSTDGTKLIEQVGSAVRMWDVATGKEIGRSAGAPLGPISDQLVFSPNGDLLATEAEKIGRLADLKAIPPGVVPHQEQEMTAFDLWESATGKPLGSLRVPVGTKVAHWRRIAWPSCDTILAQGCYLSNLDPVGNSQGRITRWTLTSPTNASAGTLLNFDDACLSADGYVVARRRQDKLCFDLFEVSTGKKLADVPRPYSQTPSIHAWKYEILVFSADHRILATQFLDENDDPLPKITLWETSTGRELYRIHMPVVYPARPNERPPVDQLVGLSPDGRLIATLNFETKTINLWEAVSGHMRLRLAMPAGSDFLQEVSFSPDSRLLAAGCVLKPNSEKPIRIWDLATGQERQCFQGHQPGWQGRSPKLVFSPDGRRLASSGFDHTVLIWGIKQPPSSEKANKPLEKEELKTLKLALSGMDAAAAYRSIRKLSQAPEQAVPLAVECLLLQTLTPEAKQVAQEVSLLIVKLDSNDFQTRMKATQKLRKMLSEEVSEPVIQSMLCKALSGEKLSIEVNNAITKLLNEVNDKQKLEGAKSAELTRMFRAIELLELIHNDGAQKALQKVTMAPPRLEVQREAEAALKRLATPQSP